MNKLKEIACATIDKYSGDLHTLGKEIWAHPELKYEEHYAHDYLTKFLEDRDFPVDRQYKIETAFRATIGNKSYGPHVAVMCEYDALPQIGHACGHNLIAEVGVAAGLGIKAAFEANGKPLGKLSVFGTPAEEGGGGKVVLLDQGVFSDVDFAMMSHPGTNDSPPLGINAVDTVKVTYKGKSSHAGAFPWEGINALDAAVSAYQMVSNLRQQMKPAWRVHGIISNGGAKPNIIPEEAELEYYIRAPNKKELDVFADKVFKCFHSAASATGCQINVEHIAPRRLDVVTNTALQNIFGNNCKVLGAWSKVPKAPVLGGASTDFGNVSHAVPSIHPLFYIGSDAVNHTREFTTASGDPKAQPYTIAQGKALAMTAIDVLTNPELMSDIKEEFQRLSDGSNSY